MPELPEVETVVRSLRPHVEGRTIRRVEFLAPRAAQGKPEKASAQLKGRKIKTLRRHGKHLLFDLDHGVIDAHLRMTGRFIVNGNPGPYTRAIVHFDKGKLLFDDIRQFGYLIWLEEDPVLGRDMLSVSAEEFVAALKLRNRQIKPLLLDQTQFAGLGNIYVDESLFRAGIHPRAQSRNVSKPRLLRLHGAALAVLNEAIEAGGSSISNYVDAEGRAGWFQVSHQVYGRTDEACFTCGAPIHRIVVGQRSTHFCPRCQRV